MLEMYHVNEAVSRMYSKCELCVRRPRSGRGGSFSDGKQETLSPDRLQAARRLMRALRRRARLGHR